jgi:hypothetical protein
VLALPSVEPLRQSVAFFPFAWVFFLQGREVNLLKKYYDFKLEFYVTDQKPNETSGTGPLKQQE